MTGARGVPPVASPRAKTFVVCAMGWFACLMSFASVTFFTCAGVARAAPTRIVSLAPNLTEILHAVGAGAQVVGVTDHCDFPAEAKLKPKVGSFSFPSLETIVSLKPDLVVATEGNNREAVARLRAGVLGKADVLEVNPQRVRDIAGVIRMLGARVGHGPEAEKVASQVEAALAQAGATPPKNRRALVLLQGDPFISVSDATWIGDAFRAAGYVNVVGDSKIPYPVVSEEFLLAKPPQIVFAMHEIDTAALRSRFARFAGKGLAGVPVVSLPPDVFVRPGPRLVQAFAFLAAHKSGANAGGVETARPTARPSARPSK